jgi:hypothetical protein
MRTVLALSGDTPTQCHPTRFMSLSTFASEAESWSELSRDFVILFAHRINFRIGYPEIRGND